MKRAFGSENSYHAVRLNTRPVVSLMTWAVSDFRFVTVSYSLVMATMNSMIEVTRNKK